MSFIPISTGLSTVTHILSRFFAQVDPPQDEEKLKCPIESASRVLKTALLSHSRPHFLLDGDKRHIYVDAIPMTRHARKALTGTVVSIALLLPGISAAQAVVQTAQLLPIGGANTCRVVTTQGIVAHVREGDLHSFDVTIGDPSYVAVYAQVGDQALPFRYMTRFTHGGGFLRHHVDLDSTRIGSGIPVSLTLLSSPPGAPTCLTVISFTVGADGSILAPGAVTTPTTPSSPTSGSSTGGAPSAPAKPTAPTKPTAPEAPAATSGPVTAGPTARMLGLCEGNGATQLWFLLLAVYVVIAALTALAKPPLAQKSIWMPLALILVPLVALLALWIFAPACRAAGWIPALSIIVAIAALLAAFREQNPGVKVIPLPAAKPSSKTPMVTKAAASSTEPKAKGK